MTQVITLPGGVTFSGFYYPEILRDLLIFLRNNKDRIGLTDENEYEVHVQMLRSFALVGHLSNTRLDILATELYLDSAKLRESFRKLLYLIGVQLRTAEPAKADLLLTLSEVTTVNKTGFIPSLSEFTTETPPVITYESSDTPTDLDRTDQVSHVFSLEQSDAGSAATFSVSQPDLITRTVGSWTAAAVGSLIIVNPTYLNKGGNFLVTEFISATQLRLLLVPENATPSFKTETGISWKMYSYSSDFASSANSSGPTFSPWGSISLQDCLYLCHKHAQVDRIDFAFSVLGDQFSGVYEYFDNRRSVFNPSAVVDNGSDLTFTLTSLLGSKNCEGAVVEVVCLATNDVQHLLTSYSGGVNVATSYNLFGQVAASVSTDDYLITSEWVPFDDQTDTTTLATYDMKQDGNVSWNLPQTRQRSWLPTTFNAIQGNWLRYRITDVGTPTAPTLDTIEIDQGVQYLLLQEVEQGETVGPQIIGSSSGQTYQEFIIPDAPFIGESEVIEVDEAGSGTWTQWTRVASMLNSNATSRHYTISVNKLDKAIVQFGDGIRGKIPPLGVNNIRATSRKGGNDSGNVGVGQITFNADGLSGIRSVTNPRPAVGWRIKDGGDTQDLERLRREGPAQTQTRGTASTPSDVSRLAISSFVDSFGERSVKRAWVVEEKYGPKTIGLLTVGSGGSQLGVTQLNDLNKYFNGDRYTSPPVEGVLITNHQVVSSALEPSLVSISATVVWRGGNKSSIESQLLAYLNPLALEDDGVTYLWNFGGIVSYSKVHDLIHNVNPNITDVRSLTINGVAGSLTLGPNELPVTTSSSLSITVVSA